MNTKEQTNMTEFFPDIPTIPFEGVDSDKPLSFKYYDPDKMIGGRTMKDFLRFSVAYWHTYQGSGHDPFGLGTAVRPWDRASDSMERARLRLEAHFELSRKLGLPFFCFHDHDLAPEGKTLKESNQNLDKIVALMADRMKSTDLKVLWGTANLFSHPRYLHGAATSCQAHSFAYAAAQVKKALEITRELGGANYVFWGGREGYDTLLNTDMKFELDNLARFLEMASDYAREIGFDGQLLIEPKPKEPTKHQYDFDAATVIGFLSEYGLTDRFKLNIEANHATLAGHTFQHELHLARIHKMLGSIDANQGDLLLGWDTDQFPTGLSEAVTAMLEVIKNGGLFSGGINFDAKVRRGSCEDIDLFYGHIAGMDTFARGLEIAWRILETGRLDRMLSERYASYASGIGREIIMGNAGFRELENFILQNGEVTLTSGKQEMLESLINQTIR